MKRVWEVLRVCIMLVLALAVSVAISGQFGTIQTAQSASYTTNQANVGTHAVSCKCSITGENTDCLASNLGSRCAPEGNPHCRDWDANCGDGDCEPEEVIPQ